MLKNAKIYFEQVFHPSKLRVIKKKAELNGENLENAEKSIQHLFATNRQRIDEHIVRLRQRNNTGN